MSAVHAVILARGGSKGVVGKNERVLNGLPLVARTITAALNSALVDDVHVSTDSDSILRIATQYDANPIKRPAELANDNASSEAALLHCIDFLELSDRDILVLLQCTSPFTTAADIDAVIYPLTHDTVDSSFSVLSDHSFVWEFGDDRAAMGITHDHTMPRQRRQDTNARFVETGAVYAMRVGAFRQEQTRFCGRCTMAEVKTPGHEIDTIEDWHRAEALASYYDEDRPPPIPDLSNIKALVTDFDGVHTDDTVIVNQDGQEAVICSRSDGMGIEFLHNAGIKLLVLSREQNDVVIARARKLRMEVCNHVKDKLPILDAWRAEQQLEWKDIAYIGNDKNDVECLNAAGVSFAPADAHDSAKHAADVVLQKTRRAWSAQRIV